MKLVKEAMDNVVYMDEHELHDLLCSAQQVLLEGLQGAIEGGVDEVRIVPTDPRFTDELTFKWSHLMTQLLQQIGNLDGEFHDDAEYTC